MKLKRLFIRLMTMAALTLMSVPAVAAPSWEKVAPVRQSEVTDVVDADAVDVSVYNGSIYLNLNSKTEVKVFTILGQLVAHQKLDAGAWRMTLPARGIYILKAGSVTRRITI